MEMIPGIFRDKRGGISMRKPYSVEELNVLIKLKQKHGGISYYKPAEIEAEFFAETGIHRASGALYMASWRIDHGYYDHLLNVA
jgi:hypothetical protein